MEPSPDQHAGGGSPWLWAVMLTALLTPGAVAFAPADTLLTLSPWWALPVMAYMALVLYAAKRLL